MFTAIYIEIIIRAIYHRVIIFNLAWENLALPFSESEVHVVSLLIGCSIFSL